MGMWKCWVHHNGAWWAYCTLHVTLHDFIQELRTTACLAPDDALDSLTFEAIRVF